MAPRETTDPVAALHLEGRSVEELGVICESAWGELQKRLAAAKCHPQPNVVGPHVAEAIAKLRATAETPPAPTDVEVK
jgi:hypothetical protein